MKTIVNEAIFFNALSQPNNQVCSERQQGAYSVTIRPVAALFLATPFSNNVPAEVEAFTDAKWRLLEMVLYWMQWAFIYAAACMIGLYLLFFISGFCIEKLAGKK